MRCPDCEEEIERQAVVENNYRCPLCECDLKEDDEFDDLMMTDFVDDGELDGGF